MPEEEVLLLTHGSDAQLRYISPVEQASSSSIDVSLSIIGSENTRRMAGVDPARMVLRQQARSELTERFLQRSASGALRWCTTIFPTHALAQEAEMALADYAEFLFRAGKLHAPDPVAAWRALEQLHARLIAFLSTRETLRIVAPGTDLTCGVAGRTWISCAGEKNFPDGEIFSAPEEDRTHGTIHFSYPGLFAGREVQDVWLRFERGVVVEARAGKGEDVLHAALAVDDGAKVLGEIAFGTNEDITRFSRNTLFDEKIGGTLHVALGASYPESGGRNESALHWNLVCDLRNGGQVYADGELVYQDGRFLQGVY
jgi:aminopeptidase